MTFVRTDQPANPHSQSSTVMLIAIASAVALLHILTNNRYGFHRDELQFLSDARHLDWGFVAYPPVTPFLEHIGLSIFGVSLIGLRLFSVFAQSAAIFLTGLMARELGGQRLAQVSAALAVAFSPLPLFEGTEFQYSSFDYLWWVLAAYCIIRLLKSGNPRWWLGIGAALGASLLTKYTILFFITGILGGLLLTKARRHFLSGWFWAGFTLALLIFLPNFLWQLHHGFISYRFLQHIHTRDVGQGRAKDFLSDQFLICVNLIAAPLWLAGLISFARSSRYRLLAWMYLIPLALFAFGKGRGYYLAAAYPMLLAMGATTAENWLASLRPIWRRTIEVVYFTGFTACGLYICALILPLASSGPLRDFALTRNGDLREEIGWDVMLQTIAQVRSSLPAQEQANVGIVVGNYGEQGAVEILGPTYHLPPAISGTNSAWLRGYPPSQPTTLIVLGVSDDDREREFTSCRLAAKIPYPKNLNNEESKDHPEIYVCGPPRLSWPELWKEALSFG
jgi:4-amino-4-deoxy-L-arabinose transferase-like glycosyltransferase